MGFSSFTVLTLYCISIIVNMLALSVILDYLSDILVENNLLVQ